MVGLAVRTTADGGEAFRIHNNSEYVPLTFHSRKDAIEHMKSLGMDIKATHDPEAEIGLFRALWPLFDNWLPTDYLSHRACVQNRKTSFIQQIPVVYGIYVRGKEYEFRRYLLDWVCSLNSQDRFKLLQVTSPREHEKCYACQLVYNGLRKTCFKMRSVDRAWANANLNVKVSHHSGWLSLCHGLHLLEKSPSRRVWDDVNALWRVMSERFVACATSTLLGSPGESAAVGAGRQKGEVGLAGLRRRPAGEGRGDRLEVGEGEGRPPLHAHLVRVPGDVGLSRVGAGAGLEGLGEGAGPVGGRGVFPLGQQTRTGSHHAPLQEVRV